MIKQDEELDKLEEDIRKLKNRYDQFFSGLQKLPPLQDRRVLESYLHELNKLKIRDNARRFRLNTLLSRYNQFREMWSRKMREREEGPIEFKRRKAALEAVAPTPPPPLPPQPRVTSAAADAYVMVAPGTNGEEIRKLYDQLEKEHVKMGKVPSITVEQLSQMVQKQTELVKSRYNVETVAFRVETVDGKVKLKAKPI